MYKITFYVPESHLESVKTALFDQGAGKIGHYDCCAWQAEGIGQYRPLKVVILTQDLLIKSKT